MRLLRQLARSMASNYEADMLEYKKDVFRRLRPKIRFGVSPSLPWNL